MVMEGHHRRLSEPLTSRQKRIMAASLAVIAVAIIAGILVASLGGGSTPASRDGCVSLTIPSTLGGAELHECGAAAREFCAEQYTRHDALAGLAQPQCALAGYRPPAG